MPRPDHTKAKKVEPTFIEATIGTGIGIGIFAAGFGALGYGIAYFAWLEAAAEVAALFSMIGAGFLGGFVVGVAFNLIVGQPLDRAIASLVENHFDRKYHGVMFPLLNALIFSSLLLSAAALGALMLGLAVQPVVICMAIGLSPVVALDMIYLFSNLLTLMLGGTNESNKKENPTETDPIMPKRRIGRKETPVDIDSTSSSSRNNFFGLNALDSDDESIDLSRSGLGRRGYASE
ncbi:MAG: hypothetical protein QNK11_01845 [Legionella sp.]|nr:hypothetical protein [Legionella sp.]